MSDRLRRPRIKAPVIPEYLNWLYFWKDYLMTKNSLLLAFLEVSPSSDYYSPEQDDQSCSAMNQLLMNLPDGITAWYETSKLISEENQIEDTSEKYRTYVSQELETLRLKSFAEKTGGYTIRRILTISYRPTFQNDDVSPDSLEAFEKILQEAKGRLSSAGIQTKLMDHDAICTYLHGLISPNRLAIKEPSASNHALSDALWDEEIDTTLVPMRLGNHFISIISIDDIPSSGTQPEMLSKVLTVPCQLRWVTRFTALSPDSAKKIIDTKRRQFLSKRFSARDIASQAVFNSSIDLMDTGEVSNYEECELALSDNGRETCFGYYTGLLILEAPDEATLHRNEIFIKNILSELGIIARSEGMNLFASWLSSLPGGLEANPRKLFISSGNMACLQSLTSPYHGINTNYYLKSITKYGPPLAYGLLPDDSIYFLNLNGKSDVGHTFIIGPTGSGKSLLLLFLASSFVKYPRSRVVYFDKGMASLALSQKSNGAWICPGQDKHTVFQPLRDAAHHKERCMSFLEAIASVENVHLTAFERKDMTECLSLMIPGKESLSVYTALLRGRNHKSEMAAALDHYTQNGAWGNLFDNGVDSLNTKYWPIMTFIEMGTIMEMGDMVAIPAISYLMGQLDELFADRKPTLLILDEAWVYFKHPVFKNFIENWLKTLRKFNVFVVMATQEISDFSDLMKSVIANCHTKIMLPNASAITEVERKLYSDIGLKETEIHLISNQKCMMPKRDYYIMQSEGNAIVNFCLDEKQLEILRTPL